MVVSYCVVNCARRFKPKDIPFYRLPKPEQDNTCLMSDETKKHGEYYEVFALRDSQEKEWILGLKNMHNKASETCLQTLKNVISDISETTNTNSGKELLVKIKNTMSDREATEKKFHALLEDYRQELLPLMYSNWDSLSSPEKEQLSRMNNFYCGLHILVNFAEVADHVVQDFEKIVKDSPLGAEAYSETARYARSNESGTVRLIRTSAKCLARGGDEKSGCYLDFKTFLNQKDEDEDSRKRKRSSLLVPFRGKRFNILFYDAEVVFYLSNLIQEFFDKVCIPANLLHKAVSYDAHEPLYLSMCKTLGLCSKLITAPFWRALKSNCSLQEASSLYGVGMG